MHDLERSFSTPSTTPFFPNRNILCPILLLGCRKYVAKNTLACQVFSRYRRKMLPKYVEKHLVTNRAAIPFIYLGACATPSNTRTNTQRRDRRERGTAGHEQTKTITRIAKENKQNQSPLTTPPGTVDVGSERGSRRRRWSSETPPQCLPQCHPQGQCAGYPQGTLGDRAAGLTLLLRF